jgi:hypothetical protein
VELLLYLIGAAATLLLILNNIARTALRQKDLKLIEIGLAFFVVLMPSAAMLLDNLSNPIFDTLETLMLLLIIPMAILSLGMTIVEAFRPQRLRQSRGLLGLGIAILLSISTFGYNIIALNAQNNALQGNRIPTAVNAITGIDPCEAAFQQLFIDVANQLADETGLSLEELFTIIESQPESSMADLIEANGGNPQAFITSLTTDMQDAIRDLLARGCVDSGQATTIIGGLPFFLPRVIFDDFSQFEDFLVADPNISPTDVQGTRVALLATLNQEPSPLPTLTATPTPSRTPSPTATRTERPMPSATATLAPFITSTPTLTATLPNPCLATANFNVNMRDFPSLEDSNVLITIPFESVITIYAPNEDRSWWYGLYEAQVGWISSEYIRLSPVCNDLPPRRP